MRRFIRIFVGVAAVTAPVVLLMAWDSSGWRPLSSALGKHNAHRDVASGRYKILTYGIANPEGSPYANLLRERYGVELHAMAGCIVSKSLVDYVAAYNEVSTTAVRGKFGRDVFRETHDEVEKSRKQPAKMNPSN
jgi:hypothetical protein